VSSPRGSSRSLAAELQLLELAKRSSAEIEIARAGVGQGDGAGRAIEKADGEAVFQCCDGSGHCSRRAVKPTGGGDKAALFRDCDERRQGIKPIHYTIP
jgi:hypothetical protein